MSSVPLPCPDSVLLKAVLTGRIEPADSSEISRHLESCEQCRLAMDHMAGLDDEPGLNGASPTAASSIIDEATQLSLGDEPPEDIPEAVARQLDQLDDGETPDRQHLPDSFLASVVKPGTVDGSLGRLAGFELLERIGKGGMGVVYRALDLSLGRQVAIKLLKPKLAHDDVFAERFNREAQAMAGISHANVITVHAISECGGIPFIVMEYVQGESLQSRLRDEGQLPLTSVIRIGAQIADGLESAHRAGIIHRDIKPSNILLTAETDEVRITDFGLAQADGSERLTRSGILLGTPKFMAPEQARGDKLDHRADLFSLGSVIYTMSVGRTPFNGLTQAEIVREVSKAAVTPIEQVDPTLPAWLTALISRLHSANPTERVQSASEVSAILREQLQRLGLSDDPTETEWLDVSSPEIDAQPFPDGGRLEETLVEPALPGGASSVAGVLAGQTIVQPTTQLDADGETGSTIRRSRRRNRWGIALAGIVGLALSIPAIAGWLSGSKSAAGTDGSDSSRTKTADRGSDAPGRTVATEEMNQNGETKPKQDPIEDDVNVGGQLPPGPYLVVDSNEWFGTLAEAVDAAPNRGIIEIATNDRLSVASISITRPVLIRAAPGFRPTLALDHTVPQPGKAQCIFDLSFTWLGLAGLQFEIAVPPRRGGGNAPAPFGRQAAVNCNGGRVQIAHCRFHTLPGQPLQVAVRAGNARTVSIRDSEFFGGSAIGWGCPDGGQLSVTNCVAVGPSGFSFRRLSGSRCRAEAFGCTFVNEHLVTVVVPPGIQDLEPDSLTVRVDRSLVDSSLSLLCVRAIGAGAGNPGKALPLAELKRLSVPDLISWQAAGNVYDIGESYLGYGISGRIEYERPADFDEWQLLWLEAESDSRADLISCRPTVRYSTELLKKHSALELFIEHFDNGRRIIPGQLPGALVTRTGPSDQYEDWIGSRNEMRWRNEFLNGPPRGIRP